MSHLALLLATRVPVPQQLPAEPPRPTPYDQAVLDHDGASGQPFPAEADYPDPFGSQPPRDAALTSLLGYRGAGFKPVRHATGQAFLASAPRPDAFELGASRKDELGRLHDVVHAYGGDGVALWTWGQAMHVWAARSPAPGTRPGVLQLALRIDASSLDGRPAHAAERLQAWLDGSPLAPDPQAFRTALAAPRLTLPEFFAAFGVAGVADLDPPDPAAMWDTFANAAEQLLRGQAIPSAARKAINALIEDSASHLPAKPLSRRGATAMRVAGAFRAVHDVLGPPAQERVAVCAAAASAFDAITGGAAADGLLRAAGKRPMAALALGRLLGHFPVPVRRDPLFLALAAHEAEVWNGHLFAGPLAELAERAGTAGFSIAVVEAAREEDLRADHGLRADRSAACAGWAAEVAIGSAESGEALGRWFVRAKADGSVIDGAADGGCKVQRFAGGAVVEERSLTASAAAQAARQLDPRGVLLAAGFPDLLAPGEVEAHQGGPGEAPPPVPPLPEPAWPHEPGAPDPHWVPPRVLLHAQNVYATADLSRLAWYRDKGLQIAREFAALYPEVDSAIPLAPQQALELHDGALRAAGCVPVGDLLASQYFACALRAYAHAQARTTATVFVLPGRPAVGCELRSRFADGAEVVTSSMGIPWPTRPGASRRTGPAALPLLWQAHEEHVGALRGGRVLQAPPATLEDFAGWLEP